jgi:hypothetical protein
MVNRMSLDLGTARANDSIIMNRWKYLFVGDCTGDVTIRLGEPSASALDPNEFDKLTGIEDIKYLYVTNIAQSGFELNIYFEEEKNDMPGIDIDIGVK